MDNGAGSLRFDRQHATPCNRKGQTEPLSFSRAFHRCYGAVALVRGTRASLAQCELGKDQRRNRSRKKPAPSPLQRALKQE